jgi:hypothetical protein
MGRVEERISYLNVLIRDRRTVGTSVISLKGDAPAIACTRSPRLLASADAHVGIPHCFARNSPL